MKSFAFLIVALSMAGLLGTIQAQEAGGLEGWSLYVDPGHSRTENQGAFGYSEAEKVLRVGLALQEMLLTTTDIDTVYISRKDDNALVSLSQRTDHANSVGAAWFHSIHSDAGPPGLSSTLMLWGQYRNGQEKIPEGGQAMSNIMLDLLTDAYRTDTRGSIGDCSFYGCNSFGPYLHVNRESTMPSELSEAGFHTNPFQNQRNMNAEWKRVEARSFYQSILEFHGIPTPEFRVLAGEVFDVETGRRINGATVNVHDQSYTTDTYESLFNRFTNNPDLLQNGFYYFEGLPPDEATIQVMADTYHPASEVVTAFDSTVTFVDVGLVSMVLPTVVSSTPAPDETNYRYIDDITLTFNRQMAQESVENAFSIFPEVGGTFLWSDNDFVMTFAPDSLQPLTLYTVSVDASAVGFFGDGFDGNGDGEAGDGHAFQFETGFPDVTPPGLVGSYPRVNAKDVELAPILAVQYDEMIDSSSVDAALFSLTPTAGGSSVPVLMEHYVVQERSVINFFPQEELAPETNYRLSILPGLTDQVGNEEGSSKQVIFKTGAVRELYTAIDDFESNLTTNWWAPQQSGSTTGLVSDSTFRSADTETVNHLTGSTTSFRLDYGWETSAGSWLIRDFLNGGAPRNVWFDDSFTLQAYIFGDASGNQFRFAIDERVPAAAANFHEVSPWITIDWAGWRLVSWDLNEDGAGSWLGNGVLEGTLRMDSFQMTHIPEQAAFGTIYIDDLRLAKSETATSVALDESLPSAFSLAQNYPNPFQSTTIVQFALPEAHEVTFRLYNALGKEVRSIISQAVYPAGTHEVRVDAAGLPSGVYFGQMMAGGQVQSIRLVVLK